MLAVTVEEWEDPVNLFYTIIHYQVTLPIDCLTLIIPDI